MAVYRSQAEVLGPDGGVLGAGTTYLHLPRGLDRPQEASGTISLRSWQPGEDLPASLRLEDGRWLSLVVERDAVSECSRNRILRFRASWPPRQS